MNTIYKVIWNDALRLFQVVNEMTRSRKRACSVKSVHTETVGGAVRKSLVAMATIGVALTAAGSALAADLPLDGLIIDLGGSNVTNQPSYDAGQLPGDGESIVIDLDKTQFTNVAGSIYTQDEGGWIELFEINGTWSSQGVDLVFKDGGVELEGNTITVDNGTLSTFTYTVDSLLTPTNALANFVLKNIQLNQTGTGYGQSLNVSESDADDLEATITGSGNITFGYDVDNSDGYLTLNPDGENTYTGRTFVGFTSNGEVSAGRTTIYFGKSNAFGQTENLNVESQAKVFIGGKDRNQDFSQTVKGLQGEGLIDLGSQANFTLAQSGTTTGNYEVGTGVIRIDNEFTGTGNAESPDSGAWFDIKLTGDVAGDIVRFSNDDSNYTGVIALTGATIEGYDATRSLDLNGGTYSPNKILTTSTLRLEDGGQLRIDGASVDSVHNLVINNSLGWSSGADAVNRNALWFENASFGKASLNVTGDLTLEQDGTVNVDSFTDSLDTAVSGKSFFDADNGLENALITVEGDIHTNGHKLSLTGKATGESGTKVTQGENDDYVADAYWDFSDELKFVDGADSDSFNIEYTLTRINIRDGMTFTLETNTGSQTGQDFTAQITGNGDLVVDASGFTVNIGSESGNSYTGDTKVTDGTNVVLTKDSGFGTGSGTLTIGTGGSVSLADGVKQSGSGLSGTGLLILGSGSEYALTQNSDAAIGNKISGDGTFKVDLGSIDHELTFTADNAFSGTLDLSNAALDLTDNADTLSSSNIILNDKTNFTFGKGSQVGSLDVRGNADLNADTIVIGGDAVLTVSGALTFDSGRTFDINDVEVADNIALIDFDDGVISNEFIDAGTFTNDAGYAFDINVSGATELGGGNLQVVRDYTQGAGNTVAETTWTLGTALTAGNNALTAGVQLTKIDVLDGKTLTIEGDASTEKTLSAQLSSKTASGSIKFSSGSIIVSNEKNDYDVETIIDAGTTVTLGASNAFGQTSELANYGTLIIGQGISQTVLGWDQVASGSISLDGSLTLAQTGAQTIANTFSGIGTFNVDLGGSGNALVFSNSGAFTGFSGTLSLSNLFFDVAGSTNYDTMLQSTDIALNNGAIFNADAAGSIKTGDFEFNGGTLQIGGITAGNPTDAKLDVAGDIKITSGSKIELEGVELQGTSNILLADNGVTQTIASFSGQVSGDLSDLHVSGVGTSAIRNVAGEENPVVAYGVWSAGSISQGGHTLDVGLTLTEIQLADTTEGLILDATGLTGTSGTTLSAKLSDYRSEDGTTTAGKIVFEGDNTTNITIGGNEANTYTGETEVTGGKVTLAKDSGFGTTSKLTIASGAKVDIGGHSQTVGALVIGSAAQNTSNALLGSGTLTIGTGQAGTSHIWGSNSFTGTIQLTANHNLSINSIAGIGGTATVGFGDNSVLTIDGATGGTFSTHLSGKGTVAVDNSTFDVSGDNTAFNGTWQLGSSGNISGSGTSSAINNALGSGATIDFQTGSLTLALSTDESTLTIDEILTGSGELIVQGTDGQSFELSQSSSGFKGLLSLEGIGMTVGGTDGSTGANNAASFADADLDLSNNALLSVASGSNVDTFKKVTVEDSARFNLGGLGFSAVKGETAVAVSGTSQLTIEELALNDGASGVIILNPTPTDQGDIYGAVNQDALISGGLNAFQTLIATNTQIADTLLNGFSISGGDDFQVTQNIQDGNQDVATGYYDFDLGLSSDKTDLGISYALKRIDIHSGQTLTLSESGELSVLMTSDSGVGNLTVASGATITLSNSGNSYTGDTTVDLGGALTAGSGALGQTDDLLVSGTFANAGANTVKHLDASGILTLNDALTITHTGGVTESTITGELDGAGALTLSTGKITITEKNNSDYTGTVGLGSGTTLELIGSDALASGKVDFADTNDSQLIIRDIGNAAFGNALIGLGTITVNLSGTGTEGPGTFTFTSDQADLTAGSKLVLDDAVFDLTGTNDFNDEVAQKLVIRVEDGSTLMSDGLANKTVSGLELVGGTVDLGELNGAHGQISLNGSDLIISGSNTIVLDSQAQVSASGDRKIGDGSDLLQGGVFELDIFTNVGSINGSSSASGPVSGLVTDSGFSGTSEHLLQNADGDAELEHVADMTRDSGSFFYDGQDVELRYSLKEIDLLWTVDNEGLLVNATDKTDASLSARITGEGNLKLVGTLNIGGTGGLNDYTGKTYVLSGGRVTAVQDSAFGTTQELNIEAGASVTFGSGIDQTVGALAGTGSVRFGQSGHFTLDNYLEGTDEEGKPIVISSGTSTITIQNAITGAADATFTIDGSYGASGSGNASVVFEQANNLSGTTFEFLNAVFNIDGLTDNDYLTASSSKDFVLSTDSHITMDAGALSDGQQYHYNELSFENGGNLAVSGVTLVPSTEGGSQNAIIDTDVLDLQGSGTLSVAAEIDDSFDLLDNDQDIYSSTLIYFDALGDDQDAANAANLTVDDELLPSPIRQGNNAVAYVDWDGVILWGDNETYEEGDHTVGMNYHVESVGLARDDGKGLTLTATEGKDSTLTATVTNYGSTAGDITFAGGTITVGSAESDQANTYTGGTYVTGGTVKFGKNAAFGQTDGLSISSGATVEMAGYAQTLGALTMADGATLNGSGTLTLGSDQYVGTDSTVSGSGSDFNGTIQLTNEHALTLAQAEGLGLTGTFDLSEGTTLAIVGDEDGTLGKTMVGSGEVHIGEKQNSVSSNVSLTANNSGFTGVWLVEGGSSLTAQSTIEATLQQLLGSGSVTLYGGNDQLNLTLSDADGTAATLSNVIRGSGDITLLSSAAGDQSFAFTTAWAEDSFAGAMTIGKSEQGSGVLSLDLTNDTNAGNLDDADFTVAQGGRLQLSFTDSVKSLNGLTFSGGDLYIAGGLNLTAADAALLTIDGAITTSDTTNIVADSLTGGTGVLSGSIANSNVVAKAESGEYVTLIDAHSGTVDLSKWTLNGESNVALADNEIRLNVDSATETVAKAVYGYQLATDASGSDLGLSFGMKEIEIVAGKQLELTESGSLSVVISDELEGQAGHLLVSSQDNLTLTGTNNYTGTTTVTGKLTAGASGLGNTSKLSLMTGSEFTNSGANSVGYLKASGANIALNAGLAIEGGDSYISGGTVNGSGALTLESGILTVSNGVGGTYNGLITLGDGTNTAGLVLDGVAGLGSGLVAFSNGSGTVTVTGTTGTTLTNTYSGAGTISVDLGGSEHIFDFDESQAGTFTGTLVLANAGYHLDTDNGNLASATLVTSGGANVFVNTVDNIGDRTVGSLTLNGGVLDFGNMTEGSDVGQIVVGGGSGGFSIGNEITTVKLSLSDSNDAQGSGVFDSNAGMSVSLIDIDGFNDATDITKIVLDSDSKSLTQAVHQTDGHTADLTFADGKLVATDSGIGAVWDLSTIKLLVADADKGFRVDATEEAGDVGSISALISGSGNIIFEGGTITLAHAGGNTYTGNTYVTGGELVLGTNEALGDTKLLDVSSGTVSFGETTQTIGSIQVDQTGTFTMSGSGSLTLSSGDSVIASANNGAVGGNLIVTSGATLELRGQDAAGALALEALDTGRISFTQVGSETGYVQVDNRLTGSGNYRIGDGTNAAYVEFTNRENDIAFVDVLAEGHLRINGMENADNALGLAHLKLVGGAYTELNGSSGWTFGNDLDVAEGGELAVSAGGIDNEFNFAGRNQNISGTVSLTDLMLTIGNNGNASALDTASVVAGSNSHIRIATGANKQQVKDFTLSSDAEITFEGELGMSGVGTNVLGQLDVDGTLTLESGSTVHVNLDPDTGSASSSVDQGQLVATAASGSFQDLITAGSISGSAVSDEGAISGIALTDSNGDPLQTVTADIKNGIDTVALGTFGADLLVSGNSFGVSYGLQAIDIVGDLTISESGSFSATISSTAGTGSLTVSAGENLTLSGANDYTVATTVTGILTAEEKALGQTESLTIGDGGQFTNAGANEVGELESSGSMTLDALLTVTNAKDGASHVSGTLAGHGGLTIHSGSLVSTVGKDSASGYIGTVTLGTSDTGAHLTLEAAADAQIGSGTIEFTNADSSLTVNTNSDAVLGNLLSGAGLVTVSGTNGESFAFKDGQEGEDIDFAGALTLTNVEYDFTTDANDILNDVSLTVNNGTTLVLNNAGDTATRKINGMSLNGGSIDFGAIGNGIGHIDLRGQSLTTSDAVKTTLDLETDLADRQDDSGSAAFETVIDDSVLLIGNVDAGTSDSVLDGLTFADNGHAFTRDLTQVTEKGTETTACIHGVLDGLVFTDNTDGTKNVEAGLTNQSLELLTTYSVRDSGAIALKIYGSGDLAVYNQLTLTNSANSYTGDTTVSGARAVLTLGDDGALGQSNLHTNELSVTDGAKVDFGSTSQTIGSITASGDDALVSTGGKLTIADGGIVSGANTGFNTAVELLDGSNDLTLTNVAALGNASITMLGDVTSLVLSGAEAKGDFHNIVVGAGGLSIVSGADVTLTGENTFAGALTVDGDSSVAASGDVFTHIGGGILALEGSADFTQTTFEDENVWTWNRTVSGSGTLSLSTDGTHELVLQSGLDSFSGSLALGDLQMTLSSGGKAMQSLTALSGSDIKSLILDAGADLHLEGATTLATGADEFGVTMKSGGSFVFEGIAVPGSEDSATNTTHLTIDGNLTLESGFELSLSTEEGAKVDPTNGKSLLEQDDSGKSISVITADDIALDGFTDINAGGDVTLDGGRDTTFEIVDASGVVVADGHYAFTIGLEEGDSSDTINLSYMLDEVKIRDQEELTLAGGVDGNAAENTLSAKLTGEGDLAITSGSVRLAHNGNDYTGATTVKSNAALYAEAGSLGSEKAATSMLTVEQVASVYIEGDNLVNGLNIVAGDEEKEIKGGTLNIGADNSDVTLTLHSSTSETVAANHIYGTLEGAGTLRVLGNGQVDSGVDPDLTIHGSQEAFDGDVKLENGAYVKIDADNNNLFGNRSVHTNITIDSKSQLTIESRYDGEGSFAGIFTNGAGGGGTVEIKLLDSSNQFRFATAQDDAEFNGTFILDTGTINYTHLYSSASGGNGMVLADATLQLNDNGIFELFGSGNDGGNTTSDVHLGGLTLDGGNIAFGSISYDADHESSASGAYARHINLGGDGVLTLNSSDEEGARTSTVTVSQDETNYISSSGSELLAADDGTSIVLIHNIGSLVIDGKDVTDEYVNADGSISSDHLQLQNEAGATQTLAQQLGGSSDYVDVAEVARTFDDELTFGQSSINGEDGKYAVSLGYKMERVGLLHDTDEVSTANYDDDSLWQGLTIQTSENTNRNEFEALITDGSNGEKGNLVLRGNANASEATLTLTGPKNADDVGTDNTYTGKTWVTDGAHIVFGANSAFGTTQALRIDSGSTVDFGSHVQEVGGLFALGDNALMSAEGSLITVTDNAVILGANGSLEGDITFESNVEIDNATSLGSGTVTLAGNYSQLNINGATGNAGGTFANTLVGGENTSVQMSGSSIALSTDQLENYEGSFDLVKSDLNLSITPADTDETVLGNVITTDADSKLSASLGDESGTKNFILAEGSKIAGELAISSGAFNLSEDQNLSAFEQTDLVIGNAGRLEVASDIGSSSADNLTLGDNSTIAFSGGGTPGSAGYDDSKGHLDLGESGTLTVTGNVEVEVDVGMVNADLVEDAMNDVSNLPLTAQDVLTADQGGAILANLVEAGVVVGNDDSFTLTVTGGDYDSESHRLEVGIFNDGSTDEVAKGIYDYTVRLTEDGLNLSYGLTGVELTGELSLKGYAESEDIDNTLSIAVTGDGSLSIDAGTITLTGKNSYSGSTTVAGGATLVTGIGGKALGNTSSLNLEDEPTASGSGAHAEIRGDETVGALHIEAKSTLTLGAAAENDRTEFTIKNTTGDTSLVNGHISGGSDSLITVIGDADSDAYDLIVSTANSEFYGDVTLQDAYVRLESINSFGSEGILRIDNKSTLEINSNADDAQTVTGDDGTVYTYHKFDNLISGDGTVRVALDDADDYFDFAEDQYAYPSGDDQAFTGTLELAVGKFRFTDRKADVLESVHVKLDGDATLDVSADTSETTDRTMRGLTLAGGTLEFGSLALDREQAEARATHIDLNGNDLMLEDSDRQVEVSLRQDATNYISNAGSEVVNAADGDGSKIVLIHDIGNLIVDGQTIATAEDAQAVLQDYLKHELVDNAEDQILHQSIAGVGQEEDVQQVARVNREFGDFGYADMSDQNLGNALYVGYEINSIELLYRGSNNEAYGADGAWKGLTVSTSDLSNHLSAQLTGQGNLVVTGGTGDKALVIGNKDNAEDNNYTGRTWVTGGADVAFADDNAFGNTSHLRVDVGSSVDFGIYRQKLGSLITYADGALIGEEGSSITVTGSAQIAGNNDGFKGNLIFDTEQITTGVVSDVDGLGTGGVYIGGNYQLQITDVADASEETVVLENDLIDVNGKGGLLQIGSGLSKPNRESETVLTGNNSNFSGTIRVEDGWSISASVGSGEDIADRLGTGSLTLVGDSTANIDFGTSDVDWNHNVDGRGTLTVTTGADNTVSIDSGFGDNFEGTFTVGGGRLDLADNADKLGNGNLAASGGNASIIVAGEDSVKFGHNLTVTGSEKNRGQLVFEDSINLSENDSPELIVDGNLTLSGALVTVSVDGELEAGQDPGDALDMSSITMADEGEIDYVIAKAGLIDMSDTILQLEKDGDQSMTVDINDSGRTVATGTYDFGLDVSTDRTELGLSYKLVAVDVEKDKLLGLQGAVSGSTSAADWANASEFSANITGAGGISLVNGNLTLTGAENTYSGATTVGDGAVLTVESSLGNTSLVQVDEGGRLVNDSASTTAGALNVAGRLDLEEGSKLLLRENGKSVIAGSLTGSGELALDDNASIVVGAGNGYEAFTGLVTMKEGAEYALSAANGATVTVRNSFADGESGVGGTVRFDTAAGKAETNYVLAGSAVGFTGTFELDNNVVVSANNIDALGGEGSDLLITTGTNGTESDKATLRFEYDDELVSQNDSLLFSQGMTEGITFEKSGDGVVNLSNNAMGAGSIDVAEGGILFGKAGQTDAYGSALSVGEGAWAAGFGGVKSLNVEEGGAFYVGGRSGYNSILSGKAATASDDGVETQADDNTVEFVVDGSVTNAGTIYVGTKTDEGKAPSDSSDIGNELVIKGDYNVTASDEGGIFDMNAIIAGEDSKADHVTITGKINGEGYIDVNYDEVASTGGTLEYLGLVNVQGGDDGDSLRLKDSIKIGDLYYRLMWSSEQNEYYLQSSVEDPGDKPWDTEDVENVGGGTRSALALIQAQTFDFSLHDHLGETLYVDPVTGEERKTTFWMVQRGDWTKFDNQSGQMSADGHVYTTHLGLDLVTKETESGTARWGVLGSFADGQFDVTSNLDGKSARGQFRGYSAGGYFAYESRAESGPFAAFQLRYNWFDNENGADKYDIDGVSFTAEAGWDQLLSKGKTDSGRDYEWRVEPHVRAYWTNFDDPEDYTTVLGETYSSDYDNGLLVRIGARTKIATMRGTEPAVQAYAEANWGYNNGDYATTVSTKYGESTSVQEGANFAELRLGIEAQMTTNVNVWLEGHHQTGSSNYESSGAMLGFKYRF